MLPICVFKWPALALVAQSGLRHGRGFLALAGLACLCAGPAQAATLGTSTLVTGSVADSNGVVLAITPVSGAWSASANDVWLHVNPATASGVGSTNVLFNYDANPGATRAGTLTIAGLTVTVTQAGSTYTPVTALITLANSASGLSSPVGVAVDEAGNVDIADQNHSSVYQLPMGGFALNILASGSLGLQGPSGLAVDGAGNVFIADGTSTVYELTNGASSLITLLSQSSIRPAIVALDGAGNAYVGDNNNGVLYQLPPGGSPITLADYTSGLSFPVGVAVDAAGNIFIADQGNNTIEELPNGSSTLIIVANAASGLNSPSGVAVDGSGNLYITDQGAQALYKLPAGGSTLATLANVSSGLSNPSGVAVDGAGNVYVADTGNQMVYELPRAFVDTTPISEFQAARTNSLPVVLPVTANLSGVLVPRSSQPWLTINSTTLGVVSFACTPNTSGTNRTASLTVLGTLIPFTQGTTNLPHIGQVTGITSAIGNTVTLNFTGQPGYDYSVERSTNLVSWATIWTTNAPPAGVFSYSDTFGDLGGTAPPAAYYRLSWMMDSIAL